MSMVWGYVLTESSSLELSRALNHSQGKSDPDPYLNGKYNKARRQDGVGLIAQLGRLSDLGENLALPSLAN